MENEVVLPTLASDVVEPRQVWKSDDAAVYAGLPYKSKIEVRLQCRV